MKKYFMTMAVMAIFAIGFAASDDTSTSENKNEAQKEVQEKQPTQKPDFLGTYAVRDKAGLTYHFTFNEDRTVKIVLSPDIPNGSHTTLTGRWKETGKHGLQLCYDDVDRIPAVEFPNGIHRGGAMDACAYFCDGYYYPDFFTCDDKIAGWRVEYTKIE